MIQLHSLCSFPVHMYNIYPFFVISAIECSCSLGVLLKCGDTPPPPPQWVTVSLLLSILRGQLAKAQVNLLTASVQAPLYGAMQSIRTTLEEAKDMYVMCMLVLMYTRS